MTGDCRKWKNRELNIFPLNSIAFINWRRTRRAGFRENRNAHKGKRPIGRMER
jgi:hypothetical protein